MSWEQMAIGTALASPTSMQEAGDLQPMDFTGSHRLLWSHIMALSRRGSLEIPTLVEIMRNNTELETVISPSDEQIRGEDYIRQLVTFAGNNMEEYSTHIVEESIRRELMKQLGLIKAEAVDRNVDSREVLDHAEKAFMGLRRNRTQDAGVTLGELLGVFTGRIEGFRTGTIQPAWTPSTVALRNKLRYVDKDDYVLIAARPGEGKSSLLRSEFIDYAQYNGPALLFNLENGPLEYAKFAVSRATHIDSEKLKDPRLLSHEDLELISEKSRELSSLPLIVISLGAPSIEEIDRITRYHVLNSKVGLVGLDYIQLVYNGIENKVQDVGKTSQLFRGMAMRYGVPHVAASQMSRSIVHRGKEAEPELSDLRESGSLEQDATIVMFPVQVWKEPTQAQLRMFPENVVNGNVVDVHNAKAVPIRIKIAKNRNGSTGITSEILWVKSTNEFKTLTTQTIPLGVANV